VKSSLIQWHVEGIDATYAASSVNQFKKGGESKAGSIWM
jgi:hypothetical protein